MPAIISSCAVLWLSEVFHAAWLLAHPNYLSWIFLPLRLIDIMFFACFLVFAIRRDGGGLCHRQYTTGAFAIYAGLSVSIIAVVCWGVFGGMISDLSSETELEAKMTLAICIADLFLWWDLHLLQLVQVISGIYIG